jgi:hypothetical protein
MGAAAGAVVALSRYYQAVIAFDSVKADYNLGLSLQGARPPAREA